jgi:hypothetical protein
LRNSVADANSYCDRDSYTYSYRNWYANSDSNANGYSYGNNSASDADSNSAFANTNSYGNWDPDRAASAHPRAQRDASRHPTASPLG